MSNESIRVIFERDGDHVPVDSASGGGENEPGGITMFGEVGAWPRRTMVALRPRNKATEVKVENVIRRMGRFQLDIGHDAGHVILTGEKQREDTQGVFPNDNLPSGFWDFTINVYPFGNFRKTNIHIREDEELVMQVPLGYERGRIDAKAPEDWDREIERVLEASELDVNQEEPSFRESGTAWVLNPKRWARRRACALNVLAVSRELHLIEKLRGMFLAEVDRAYFHVDPAFENLLDDARFHVEGEPGHPTHRRILDALELTDEEKEERWQLRSYRHKRNPSMQVVVAREKEPTGDDPPTFVELDIDHGNPKLDLVGFFTHLAEVAHPGRTNHIRLHEKLADTNAKAFLAYTPISA